MSLCASQEGRPGRGYEIYRRENYTKRQRWQSEQRARDLCKQSLDSFHTNCFGDRGKGFTGRPSAGRSGRKVAELTGRRVWVASLARPKALTQKGNKPMTSAEHTMKTWDGLELFYRSWTPETPTDKALLLFHRGHEHSGRWQEFVELLGLEGCRDLRARYARAWAFRRRARLGGKLLRPGQRRGCFRASRFRANAGSRCRT